jgi:hypothetical protein
VKIIVHGRSLSPSPLFRVQTPRRGINPVIAKNPVDARQTKWSRANPDSRVKIQVVAQRTSLSRIYVAISDTIMLEYAYPKHDRISITLQLSAFGQRLILKSK